jgi:hypothetical protein
MGKLTDLVAKSPIVPGLVLGGVFGVAICKHINKCSCDKTVTKIQPLYATTDSSQQNKQTEQTKFLPFNKMNIDDLVSYIKKNSIRGDTMDFYVIKYQLVDILVNKFKIRQYNADNFANGDITLGGLDLGVNTRVFLREIKTTFSIK